MLNTMYFIHNSKLNKNLNRNQALPTSYEDGTIINGKRREDTVDEHQYQAIEHAQTKIKLFKAIKNAKGKKQEEVARLALDFYKKWIAEHYTQFLLKKETDIISGNLKNEKGELVCKNPFPSMPLKFWNDKKDKKFKDAYFNRFNNIWHHGDFAEIKKTNGLIIHGRSDTTLNPGGVRLGTAEIYTEVERFKEVKESIVVGQSWDNDVRIILFIVMNTKFYLTEDLLKKIKFQIKKNASPRHVPSKIIEVKDIPRTKSGKIVELAVKNILDGNNIKNKEALANPEALKQFKNLKELSN